MFNIDIIHKKNIFFLPGMLLQHLSKCTFYYAICSGWKELTMVDDGSTKKVTFSHPLHVKEC